MIRDVLAAVVRAVGRLGPAVVGAGTDEVDLVPALRAHLGLPEVARGVERETERVAVSPRPDLVRRVFLVRERIALCGRAIGIQPQDLAEVGARVLRGVELLPLPGGDEQVGAVGAHREPVPEVALALHLRHLPPDDIEVLDASADVVDDQPPVADDRPTRPVVAPLHPAEVDPLVLLVGRSGDDVAETALAAGRDLGLVVDVEIGTGLHVADDQLAAPLGDRRVGRARQERHRPRFVVCRDLRDLEWRGARTPRRRRSRCPGSRGGGAGCRRARPR